MDESYPVSTPQAPGNLPDPVEDNHAGINDPKLPYRKLVGSRQYLDQGTCSELANAVRTLGKYMNKYNQEHFVCATKACTAIPTRHPSIWTLVEAICLS